MIKTDDTGMTSSIIKAIKYRTSIRTYDGNLLSEEMKNKLQNRIDNEKGPFNVNVRLKLIGKDYKKNSEVKLGTYGLIKGAESFIVSTIKKEDGALEELGYILEDVILYATSIGIGSVWLGGTFNKTEFSKVIDMQSDEIMPIITPVGKAASQRGMVENIMRIVVGAKKRKEFNKVFFHEDFNTGLTMEKAAEYSIPLEMVRLAPSASNKQPWRIIMSDEGFHFFLNHSRGYGSFMGFDMQRIDMGIAMYHFEATANELNLKGHWSNEHKVIGNATDNTEFIINWIKD